MATVTVLAALNALMREKFSPEVAQTFSSETILLMMLRKINAEQINNRGGRFPMRTRRSNSFVGGTEAMTLPEPKEGLYEHFTPALRAAYGTGGVSGWLLWQQDVDTVRAQFKELSGMVAQKINDERGDFEFHLEDTAFKDGKGKLASAITAVTTGVNGTVTVSPATANYELSEDLIGAEVNFYSSTGVLHNTGAATSIITAVDEATGVATCDNVPTNAAVGDFPVWAGSWDLVPIGLEGLIQNQNVVFQGVNVTGKNNLKSIMYDAAGAGFDIKVIDRIRVRTQKRQGVGKPGSDSVKIITHPKQVNAYRFAGYALSTVLQTGSNRNASKLDLAYSSVEIGGKRIYESNQCGERDIYGVDLDSLRRFSLFEPGILNLGGGKDGWLMPRPAGSNYQHAYLYFFAFYGNMFMQKPTANFRYLNLDKSNLG